MTQLGILPPLTSHRHTSDSAEWYTPNSIVGPARALMGGIDLDPASCERANTIVQAARFFDEHENGFTASWAGRVFLNPPGGYCDAIGRRIVRAAKGRPGCDVTGACGLPPGHKHDGSTSAAKAWWSLLAMHWSAGRVDQAVFVGFNAELLRSTQSTPWPAMRFPFCMPSSRVSYLHDLGGPALVEGVSPPHPSVIVWLPPRGERDPLARFEAHFGSLGCCVGYGANPACRIAGSPEA